MKLFFLSFQKVFKLLPKVLKIKFWLLLGVILITSVIDLLGLASFIPLLSALVKPEIMQNHYVKLIGETFGIQKSDDLLLLLFLGAMLFFVFRTLFILLSNWIQNKFVMDINEHLGVQKYKEYLYSNYEDFKKKDVGEIIRELTVNPQHFARFLVYALLLITSESVVIILVIIGIGLFNFQVFVLICLTLFPVAILFSQLVKKRMRKYGEIQNELTPILLSLSSRGMHGYEDVKLRSKEKELLEGYLDTLKKLNVISLRLSVLSIVPAKLFELITVMGLVIIFAYGLFVLKDTSAIIAIIALYAAAGYRVMPSLSKIVPAFMQLEQYSYLFTIFYPRQINYNEVTVEQKDDLSFSNAIKISNLDFKFSSSDYILKGLDLEIKKGEFVGFIGKTGSGKTTLIKILTGFLKPSKGSISIDGQILSQELLKTWMDKISYVQQGPYLEKGSLSMNVAFLEKEVDKERLQSALKAASLSNFIDARDPDSILIEEMGKNLSGGQKQRIAIARALYHKSEIIILDEATSALDNETEQEINEAIRQLKNTGVTILIIAHRVSTLKHCDQIYEIENRKTKNVLYKTLQ
jgi:ABC-type bacteriocin/lantibiotic exporter with double-glycine peptidase domain